MNVPQHVGFIAIGGAGWMGGANYIRHLAAALREVAPEVRISFICGEPLLPDWRETQPRIDIVTRKSVFRSLFGRRDSLKKALAAAGVDFVYPISFDNEYNLALRFPIGSQLGPAAWAGWIPDFQHRYLPELFPSEEIDRRERRIAELVAEARCVVLSSDTAARDFAEFYPQHVGKSTVLHFATPPVDLRNESDNDRRDIPERFFLVCNQFWKHKNHLVLFDALRLMRARGIAPAVLCTGELDDYRDHGYAGEVREALAKDNLQGQVRLLGLVPRTRQLALMRRAVAVIQPSLFEGWSSVVEDVRALGRPSLLSDIPVHREQNPPRARFFPPRSAETLAELLAEAHGSWPPGPDLPAEKAAHALSTGRLAEVGRRFLEIAATTLTQPGN